MKVLFPSGTIGGTTGKVQFLRRLMVEFEKYDDIKIVTENESKIDIELNLIHVEKMRNRKAKQVVRIDGTNTPDMKTAKRIGKALSIVDGVVYQSEYAKKATLFHIKKRIKVKTRGCCIEEVIFNGADPEFYNNIQPAAKVFEKNIITVAKWRRLKRLKETTRIFLDLIDRQDVGLIVIGQDVDYKVKHPNIKYLGKVDPVTLGSYYKMCDVQCLLSWTDACPNTVVECINAGTPCVVGNQGGSHELLGGIKNCGMSCNIDPIYNWKSPVVPKGISNAQEVADSLIYYLDNPTTAVNSEIHIANVALRYKSFFEKILG